MTPISVEQSFSDNQTSSFIETSTALDNSSYGNNSGIGNELLTKNVHSTAVFPFSEIYVYSYWGVLVFVVVTGLIGNILLFIMVRDKQLNLLPYVVYLKALALCDSLVLITGIIRETEKVFSVQGLSLLNDVTCKIFFFSRILVPILSPWLMVGLTLDRYVCVCFPLKRNVLCTKRKAKVICSIMLTLSILLAMPFLFKVDLIENQCAISEKVKYYFIFFRLVASSSIPCLCILVLNIIIITQMHRSRIFRNTFSKSTTETSNQQQDKATRPLVLVSVLAFVTLLPVSVAGSVRVALEIFRTDFNLVILTKKAWLILNIFYLLNFGQNFYILMGSSSNYRSIIKRRLARFRFKTKERNPMNEATQTNTLASASHDGSGMTDLSVVSFNTMCSGLEPSSSGNVESEFGKTMDLRIYHSSRWQ